MSSPRRPRMHKPLRAFLRDERAATALEFALVAPPFFFMILAIFELALVFVVSVTLDSATQTAGRLVRTGQAQNGAYTEQMMEQAVCSNLGWLSGLCKSDPTSGALTSANADGNNVYIDTEVKSSFGAANTTIPINASTCTPSNTTFNMGAAGDIIIMRVYLKWPLITPVLYGGLQTCSGAMMMNATTVFRNEPYT